MVTRALPVLLLLLLACAASGLSLFGGAGCKDHRGRRGEWQQYDHCKSGEVCTLVAMYNCVVPDLPPRLAGGLWECDEHYQLAGSRITWPGGVLAVEPEKCSPV